MNRPIALLAAALAAASLGTALANDRVMTVQVREGQVRESPSFLAPVTGVLPYTARVTAGAPQGAWIRVKSADPAIEGWMHTSALTARRLALQQGSGTAGTGVSEDELALAGKGFSATVEAEFKARNKDIDFSWIDRMEQIRIPADERQKFLAKAGLGGEGAR